MSLWFTMRYVEVPTDHESHVFSKRTKRLWKTSDLTTKLLMWALQWIPIPRVHVTTSLPPRGGSQARLPTKTGYFWGQVRGGILNSHHTESAVPIDPCHVDCAPSCMCHMEICRYLLVTFFWHLGPFCDFFCWQNWATNLGHKVSYCWWTKSCITKDDDYPIIYRVLTIPGRAGFLPSTVSMVYCEWKMSRIPSKMRFVTTHRL